MYILSLLQQNPFEALIFLFSLVVAISIHEYAHAATAVYFGDETPKLMGRTTLNPAAHIDPLGAIFFLILGFGWGKPVIINPIRLGKKIHELIIALAGPLSNLCLALAINLFLLVASQFININDSLKLAFQFLTGINVALAAFNIIPIPPLDGSSILAYFFPNYKSFAASQFGFLILIFLLFFPGPGGNLLHSILIPIYSLFSTITLSTPIIN